MFARLVSGPLWLYAAAGALAVGAGLGWSVRDAFCDAAKADALEAAMKKAEKQTDRMNEAAGKLEDYRYANDQASVSIQRDIRTIYRDRVIRPDCDVDPASRGLLDRARNSANAAASGESGETMQGASSHP